MNLGNKSTLIASAALVALFALVGIAYGGWFTPGSNPPSGDVAESINVGSDPQQKLGGLKLNTSKLVQFGLVVYGTPGDENPFTATGRVGIGINNPEERLDVVGNIGLTGILRPNGADGKPNQILTKISQSQIGWTNRLAWMTIPRLDLNNGNGCVTVFPACPTTPSSWTEYEVIGGAVNCSQADGTWSYGAQTRVCYCDSEACNP